jgi:hypothetical protein
LEIPISEYKHEKFPKNRVLIFSNSAFSRNFKDFLDKCCHISVEVKYISKISTVMNCWDVNLKVRVPFSNLIHKRALSEMFENLKNTFHVITLLTVRDKKNKWIKGKVLRIS